MDIEFEDKLINNNLINNENYNDSNEYDLNSEKYQKKLKEIADRDENALYTTNSAYGSKSNSLPKIKIKDTTKIDNNGGYHDLREEFEIEFQNDFEQEMTKLEFKENDSQTETDIKLITLEVYNDILNKRTKRKR